MPELFISPEASALLGALYSQDAPGFSEMSPAEARTAFREMVKALDPPPAPVCPVEDLVLDLPGRRIGARLYGSAVQSDALTLYFHGGGWVAGNLETHDGFCRDMALTLGSRVLAVDYRLAPEFRFPAALDDCVDVLRKVHANSAMFSPPVGAIGLAGDSAGGNLAAAVALAVRDTIPLAGLLLLYPVIDLVGRTPSYESFAKGFLLEAADMEHFIASYAPEPAQKVAASPAAADDLSSLPATVLVTCGLDPLRDEGRNFAARLVAAGVYTTFIELRGMPHGVVTLRQALPSVVPLLQQAQASYAQALSATSEEQAFVARANS